MFTRFSGRPHGATPVSRSSRNYLVRVLVLSLWGTGALVFAAEIQPHGTYTAIEVGAPAKDGQSIPLPGKSVNPTRESWLNIANPADHSGFAGPSIVRNVSQAALTPFLPDPKKATGTAMIIAPGGGGVELSMDLQGYQVARWLNDRGIAAFVLKYRLTPTPEATSNFLDWIAREAGNALEGTISAKDAADGAMAAQQDGLEAVWYIRSHAAQWKLRPDRIGLMGFSAGAFTTINVAIKGDERTRPNVVAIMYGALADWNEKLPSSAPPAFIAASSDDAQVPAIQGLMVYKAWKQANIPAELHLFETGGHGFAMGRKGTSSDQWLDLYDHWLRAHDFAPKGDLTSMQTDERRREPAKTD